MQYDSPTTSGTNVLAKVKVFSNEGQGHEVKNYGITWNLNRDFY